MLFDQKRKLSKIFDTCFFYDRCIIRAETNSKRTEGNLSLTFLLNFPVFRSFLNLRQHFMAPSSGYRISIKQSVSGSLNRGNRTSSLSDIKYLIIRFQGYSWIISETSTKTKRSLHLLWRSHLVILHYNSKETTFQRSRRIKRKQSVGDSRRGNLLILGNEKTSRHVSRRLFNSIWPPIELVCLRSSNARLSVSKITCQQRFVDRIDWKPREETRFSSNYREGGLCVIATEYQVYRHN